MNLNLQTPDRLETTAAYIARLNEVESNIGRDYLLGRITLWQYLELEQKLYNRKRPIQ